jgi:4a-hydroxytetrahydrobiopterin dehydratase
MLLTLTQFCSSFPETYTTLTKKMSTTLPDCSKVPPLDRASAEELFKGLCSQWRLEVDADDYLKLIRKFSCKNWAAAINFINSAGVVAEEIGHHPDLSLTKYRNIEVVVFTQSTKALTTLDFQLAKGLDTIAIEYSPKWLEDNPLS